MLSEVETELKSEQSTNMTMGQTTDDRQTEGQTSETNAYLAINADQ